MDINNFSITRELLKSRTILLFGEVAMDMAAEVNSLLTILDNESHAPITIQIDSPGGSFQSGFAIYDTIKVIESPVITIATGLAASAASLILSAGDRRFALPHASIVLHQIQLQIPQTDASTFIDTAKNIEKSNKMFLRVLAENTGISYEQLEKDTHMKDLTLTPEEAMHYGTKGLITEIKSIAKKDLSSVSGNLL